MAKINCIVPSEAEKLKKAFRSGEISISKLFELTSKQRVDKLAKYIGADNAQFFVARLERAYMMPRQKQSMRNVIYKMFGEKPLYKGVSIDEASEMSKNLKISDLKPLSITKRTEILSKYIDRDVAEILSQRFEDLRKSGNLILWEKKAFGTEKLREQKQLKGSLAKLEALNDMGVLTPEETEKFMKTFVEDSLNLSINPEQSRKLSQLVEKQENLLNKIQETGDWTYKNKANIEGYFKAIRNVRAFQQKLIPQDATTKINTAIDYARASILGSYRIVRNSALYQSLPTLERYINKRIIPAGIGDKELSNNIGTILKAKKFAITPSQESLNFIQGQLMMATRIYKDTGFEVSRMENLDDGFNLFGGEKFRIRYKDSRKIKDVKGVDKIKLAFNKYIDTVINSPKWTAGGTDMVAANLQRADTSIMMSRELSFLEANKKSFKTPEAKDKWIKDRSLELVKDSYSFAPETDKGAQIRAQGIFDAHLSNNTQPSGLASIVINIRDSFTVGNIQFGKLLIPFARIASTTIGRGINIGLLPITVVRGLHNINQVGKITDSQKRIEAIRKNVSMLVGTIGLGLTTILIASLLDDDDYIGSWDTISYKEYGLARARGAGAGYVRIGGQWIPIRFLPMVNIPLAGIMKARQDKAKGAQGIDTVSSYLAGMLGGLLDTPGFREINNLQENIRRGASSSKTVEFIDGMGLDGESLFVWAKVRSLPSVLSYDMWNAIFPKESKYDFLGEEVGKNKNWIGFKADMSNDITLEFNRLNNKGLLPVISDPTGRDDFKKQLGEKEYQETLARYKRNYAEEVSNLINSNKYKRMSDEDKKDEINNIRQEEILDKTQTRKSVPLY